MDQQQDMEERQREVLEALETITKAGFEKEAEVLAYECGLGTIWRKR